MGRRLSEEEKKKRTALERQKQLTRESRFLWKKAEALNKIMKDRKISRIEHEEGSYAVYYKNGQVFKFTFLPDSLFLENRILPREVTE